MKDDKIRLPHELKILLACLRLPEGRLEGISDGPVDWDVFIKLAVRHRVWPLVYCNVKEAGLDSLLPQEIFARLAAMTQKNTGKMLGLAAELAKVTRLLNDNGIRFLSLKGPLLSKQLYGDIALRPAKDLDILVPPADLRQVGLVLRQAGYSCPLGDFSTFNDRQIQASIANLNHFTYVYPANPPVRLEIHCHLNGAKFNDNKSSGTLWQHLRVVDLAGTPITVLPHEKNILYLFTHGAFHGWFRLRWLVDVARYVQDLSESEWSGILKMAKQHGVESCLIQGAILAHELLGIPIPQTVHRRSQTNKRIYRLLTFGYQYITNPIQQNVEIPVSIWQHRIYRYCLYDSSRQKITYMARHFSLSPDDIKSFAFPNFLFPLYYLTRLFLYVHRKLSARIS